MAIKKSKGGVRDPSKATKHQLVAENWGGDSPVFLSPPYSYLFSPGLDSHGLTGRFSERRVIKTGLGALWLCFCLFVCFYF